MIPMLATNSSIEVPVFWSWVQATPQIANTASINISPWLNFALAQVREIEESGELIPGLGDLRVASQTAKRARLLLSSIGINSLPTPLVSPVSGGGVSITWSLGLRELKLSFDPNGEITFFKIEDDEISDDGPVDVRAPFPIAAQLQWMLDTPV
jgi:hypothetical protein